MTSEARLAQARRLAAVRRLESVLFDGDPIAALDARIAVLQRLRAEAVRFSEAFWDADDAISRLRILRDEVRHTGRVRAEVLALIETPQTPLVVDGSRDSATSWVTGPVQALGAGGPADVDLVPLAPEPAPLPAAEPLRRAARARGRREHVESLGV